MGLDTCLVNQFLSPKPTRLKRKLKESIWIMKGSWSAMEAKEENAKDQTWFPRHISALSKDEPCPEDAATPILMGCILSQGLSVQISEFQEA